MFSFKILTIIDPVNLYFYNSTIKSNFIKFYPILPKLCDFIALNFAHPTLTFLTQHNFLSTNGPRWDKSQTFVSPILQFYNLLYIILRLFFLKIVQSLTLFYIYFSRFYNLFNFFVIISFADSSPGIKHHPRLHAMSVWLHLIPKLHNAGANNIFPAHNAFTGTVYILGQ